MLRLVSIFSALVLIVMVFGSANKAEAVAKTWDGDTNTNWNTAANWSGNTLPANGDDLTIPDVANDPVISAASSFSAHNVTVSTGVLTMNGSGSLTATDNLTVNGTLTISAGTLTGQNDFSGSGTITMSGGTLKIDHDWKVAPSNFSASGGTVEFTGSNGGMGLNTSGDYSFYNLTVDAGMTETVHDTNPRIVVANNLRIGSGAKLVLKNPTSPVNTANALYLNSVLQAPGTYTSATSGGYFTGSTGSLLVATGSAPTVLSVTPADSTTNVIRTSDIVVVFDQSMNTASVEAAFSTSPSAGLYTYVWSTTTYSNDTVTISHAAPFPGHILVTPTISTGATSSGSVALAAPYSWSFTTKSSSSTTTTTTTTYNSNGTTTVTVTTNGVTITTTTGTPTTPPTTEVVTCSQGQLFSVVSGKACTTFTTSGDINCPTGGVYDVATGKKCTIWAQASVTTNTANGSVTTTVTISKSVGKGSPKSEIMKLQAALNKALKIALKEDGIWGGKTMAAIKQFQAQAKLSADGKVGPMTSAALNAAVSAN